MCYLKSRRKNDEISSYLGNLKYSIKKGLTCILYYFDEFLKNNIRFLSYIF